MDQRLSIITIAVADLERSRSFYRDAFGWSELTPTDDNIVFFQLNGFQLALYPRAEMGAEHDGVTGAPQGFTLAYNVNSTDEVDAIHAGLLRAGATNLKSPSEVFWGGYSSYIAGPDGEQWEIAYNPFTAVNPDGTFGESAQ